MRHVPIALTLLALASGCKSPSERAVALEIQKNPLRDARVGEACRYRAVRTGNPGEKPVVEEWTLRDVRAAVGRARVEVCALGPNRAPPAPSPREPAYDVLFPMSGDSGFSALQLVRLFHRPELTPKGMEVVIDRDVRSLEGSVSKSTGVVGGKVRELEELAATIEGPALVRGEYRAVFVDELPVLGIVEAELDEVWTVVGPDGEMKQERRHDRLELVDWRDATDSR